MRITRHGEKRSRQRLGLPKRTVEAQAARALADGRGQAQFVGSFRKHLDWLGREYLTSPIVYDRHIYVFDGTTLITVFPVPNRFRNHIK